MPDGYDGELWDLVEVDDSPFTEDDVEGVPGGYRSNWLDRAVFAVDDVNERTFDVVDPA